MRKNLAILLAFTCNSLFGQVLAPVDFDTPSGIYSSDVTLTMSHSVPGVSIYYTLNGDEPTTSDFLYMGPITLQSRNGEMDSYATIPTNPSFTAPVGDYSVSRSNNRGWLAPYSESFKVNIVRAKAFKTGHTPSITSSHTYMVDPAGSSRFSLPIVSLMLDSTDLFADDSGIYVYGNHPSGNYTRKGSDWEKIAHIEFFDEMGNSMHQQDIRMRMHGGGSRHSTKKNMRLYGEYNGITNFNVELFKGTEQTKFKRLLIRAGGHRPDCLPRDDMANAITEGLNCHQQHYRRIILFINGEYWGIHSIKERMDNYFFQNQFGVDDNDITVLDQEYDVQSGGHAIDATIISNLEDFLQNNDMTQQANFDYVAKRMDMDNYIDYMASEIFLSNQDWVYSNVVIWRKTGPFVDGEPIGHDGKFRWAMYDMDGAFGGSCSQAYYTVNTLQDALVSSGIYTSYTRIFRGLMESPIFRDRFINRMSDLTNSWFKESVVRNKMDEFHTALSPDMLENVERWRYPSEANNLADRDLEVPSLVQWDTLFYHFRRFADRRPRKIREHMIDQWNLNYSILVTVNVNDVNMGRVQVNTLLINELIPGTSPTLYPWNGVYIDSVEVPIIAVPLPGFKFVEWQGTGNTNDTIYWTPATDTMLTAVFALDNTFQPVVINELMPSNSNSIEDNFQQNDDWLELYNPNPYPVNISGSSFMMNSNEWVIPNGTIIEPDGYKVFWMDGKTYQGKDHANFRLSNMANTIYLKAPHGGTIDSMAYPMTDTDRSYGRYPNGSATLTDFESPTPYLNNNFTGTEELDRGPDLMVYPNPATEQVYFNKNISFDLFDLSGRWLSKHANIKTLPLNGLSKGVYLIITDKGEKQKFVIN